MYSPFPYRSTRVVAIVPVNYIALISYSFYLFTFFYFARVHRCIFKLRTDIQQHCNRIKTENPQIELRSPRRITLMRLLYPEEWQNSALKYRSVDENDITRHGRYVTTFRCIYMLKLRTRCHEVYYWQQFITQCK